MRARLESRRENERTLYTAVTPENQYTCLRYKMQISFVFFSFVTVFIIIALCTRFVNARGRSQTYGNHVKNTRARLCYVEHKAEGEKNTLLPMRVVFDAIKNVHTVLNSFQSGFRRNKSENHAYLSNGPILSTRDAHTRVLKIHERVISTCTYAYV